MKRKTMNASLREKASFWARRVLSASRYCIIVAVICIFIAATILLVYGSFLTANIVTNWVSNPEVSSKGSKTLLLGLIELVDLFLLATVFYITSVGLYELFIAKLDLPDWLVIDSLDMLKDKLIGVVVVVLSVLFLGQIISWDGQRDLLGIGVAIASVIGTLTYFLNQKAKEHPSPLQRENTKSPQPEEE